MGCDTHEPTKLGGGERIRTDDILLAKQALYQLSYAPGCERSSQRRDSGIAQSREKRTLTASSRQLLVVGWRLVFGVSHRANLRLPFLRHQQTHPRLLVVGQGGFEPPTSRLSSARSNQLSY